MLRSIATAGTASVIGWFMVGAVVVASVWHPFGRHRSAAFSAGLRLAMTFALLVALLFVPNMFDRGNLDGTDTCPHFINDRSDAWWAAALILDLTCWSGIGVLKASAASLSRREGHSFWVLLAAATAIAIGLIAVISFSFAQICP